MQLLLLEVCVLLYLLLELVPHFLDVAGLLVARRGFIDELLVQIPALYLFFFIIALSLLRQSIQVLYLLHQVRDLLLCLRPLLVQLLLVRVLELLDDLMLLSAELVDLGQVSRLDFMDHSLVLILQQLQILINLQHGLAALSSLLQQHHFLLQVDLSDL